MDNKSKELNIGGIVIKTIEGMPENMGMFIPDKPSFPPAELGEEPMVKYVKENCITIHTIAYKPEE